MEASEDDDRPTVNEQTSRDFDEFINSTVAASLEGVSTRTIERWMKRWTDDRSDWGGLQHDHGRTTRRWLHDRHIRRRQRRLAMREQKNL